MIYAILSDIHANYTALKAVLDYIAVNTKKSINLIILGDIIDYGPRPNETIKLLMESNIAFIIMGNHENSLLTRDYTKFSSARGIESLKYTESILNEQSKKFITHIKTGILETYIDNRSVLLVHGDLNNIFWGEMNNNEKTKEIYSKFDFVLSGHTHIPCLSEMFYYVDNAAYRNKKKTCFINPGSVGQPRNHSNLAQFCLVDFETQQIHFEKVPYDIETEMSFFQNTIDPFYKERLKLGV